MYLRYRQGGKTSLPTDKKGGAFMKRFSMSHQQIQDFALSCFELIISEIKNAYEAEGTETPDIDIENTENDIAA